MTLSPRSGTAGRLAAVWLAACTLPVPAANLLLLSQSSSPNYAANDGALVQRLQLLGHTVTVAGGTVTTGQIAAADGILFSALLDESAMFSSARNALRDTAQPVLCWSPTFWDNLRMINGSFLYASNTAFTVAGQTQIAVTGGAHPLAAGFSGNTAVLLAAGPVSFGAPFPSADTIATAVGDPAKAVIFAYEAGDVFAGGFTCPGKRVAFFPNTTTPSLFNDNAFLLFDKAVEWMVGPAPGIAAQPARPERESPGPCSRRTDLVITELHYHPAPRVDGRNLEFLEVYNASPFAVDLAGHRLEGAVTYTFPPATTLSAFGYRVVAKAPADLQAVHGLADGLGPYTGQLDNDGAELRLIHPNGAVLLEVAYDDDPPWPAAADGAGHSLILARPSYGERGDARAWEKSTFVGGSPGAADPAPADPLDDLRINELLANTTAPQQDFVELYNHGVGTLDLSGVQLADNVVSNRFVVPPGTTLGPGQKIAFYESQLGFAFSAGGEAAYVWNAAGTRVLDAFVFGPSANGVSFGRVPDGAPEFTETALPTPGAANAGLLARPVVINEIMFHPITHLREDEYIELHNTGTTTVSIANWRLTDAVTFTFPAGASIPAGGLAVAVRDRTRFLSRYPAVNPAVVFGNWSGSLSDNNERIRLRMPNNPAQPSSNLIVVDEVHYRDGGSWGRWADGGGSSLELIDPRADNRLAANWADSDESFKAAWQTFTHTGVLDNGWTGTNANEVGVIGLGAGEWLVDQVEVRGSPDGFAANRVPNPDFETNAAGWDFRGNHSLSAHHTAEGAPGGSRSLRVVATNDGDNGANLVEADISPALVNGNTGAITARVRWLRGSTNLLFRLQGNYLELAANPAPPPNLGTPGAPNSRAAANAAPSITETIHRPVLPAAGQMVAVRARVADPDGVASVTLRWRLDGAGSDTLAAMWDNGTLGDRAAGDGVYLAYIPGQAAGATVRFSVEASDAHAAPLATRFPSTAGRDALIRFGETAYHANFKATRLWLTAANLSAWTTRPKMSNLLIDCTTVHGDERVIYESGARYRGSPFIRPGYSAPNSGTPNLVFEAPKDERVRSVTQFNLDGLEPGKDNTSQRERLTLWLSEKIGGLFNHQRYTHLAVQGTRLGTVYVDVQDPDGDYLQSWFPGEDGGEFFEIDDWFEFHDSSLMAVNINATLQNFTTTGGQKKTARYRWNWEKNTYDEHGAGYGAIFSLVDAMNTPAAGYVAAVRGALNLDHWWVDIGLRRVVGDWDGYGYERGKNTFLYRTPAGKYSLIPWDLDFSLGGGSRATNANLFVGINDPTLNAFYNTPATQRHYWAVLKDYADGPMVAAAFNARSAATYAVLSASGLGGAVTDPALTGGVNAWVAGRRAYILSQLATVNAVFDITTNGGANFSTATSPVTLAGTAPVEALTLTLNGFPVVATWNTVTGWQVPVSLAPGANTLVFGALDRRGNPLPGLTDTITVTYTGGGLPLAGNLKITEIMYNPPDWAGIDDNELEFIELKNTGAGTLDLSGAAFAGGIQYTFPSGVSLAPGAFLLLASNPAQFSLKYPWRSAFAEYADQLSNGGESISLLDPSSNVVSTVTYDDVAPWPVSPDGLGPSLVPVNPNPVGSQDDPAQWRASTLPGGSPGEDDPDPNLTAPPAILVQPLDATGSVGQVVAFLCRVTGVPAPAITWTRDGVVQAGQDWMVLRTAPLVALDQGAQFRCEAVNAHGQAVSRLATLTVAGGVGTPAQPGVVIAPDAASVSFASEAGVIYRLQYSDALPASEWLNTGDAFVGAGGVMTVPLPTPAIPRRYYRVAAWSP